MQLGVDHLVDRPAVARRKSCFLLYRLMDRARKRSNLILLTTGLVSGAESSTRRGAARGGPCGLTLDPREYVLALALSQPRCARSVFWTRLASRRASVVVAIDYPRRPGLRRRRGWTPIFRPCADLIVVILLRRWPAGRPRTPSTLKHQKHVVIGQKPRLG